MPLQWVVNSPFSAEVCAVCLIYVLTIGAPFLTAQPEPAVVALTRGGVGAAGLPLPLKVTFSKRTLTFSGVTPGGKVAMFGLAREALNTTPITPATVVRAEILTDTDGDGVVRLTLAADVPPFGMWAAADLGSGAHLAFPTPGYEPRLVRLMPDLFRNDSAGQLRKIEWPFGEIDVFVARPGEGAWRSYASKTSALDENRANGIVSLRFDAANMIAIGDSPEGPSSFQEGDIVAIFDRREMQYGMIEVQP